MPILPPSAFAFCGATYQGISPVIDAERSINLFPESEPAQAKGPIALIGRPAFAAFPFATLPFSPVRALWPGYSRLFAVYGAYVAEMSNLGTVLQSYGAMPGSLGYGNCSIQANTTGDQLIIMDWSAASVYNCQTTPSFAMVPATDGFSNRFYAVALEYLDGFFVAIAFGASLQTDSPNQINVSNNEDGTIWDPLNYVIRSGSADAVIQLAVLNSLLWIFGQKTIEIWYDAGNPLFPFARMQGGTINLGCMAQASVAKFYNTIMWLGADGTGYPQVYMTQGMAPVRVSTPAIEAMLNAFPSGWLPYSWAYAEQQAGHTFYVLNLCSNQYVPQQTLVYDLTTQLWHERAYGFSWPVSFASVPGFGNAQGSNFVGDGLSGKIQLASLTNANDNLGNAITYTRTAPVISNLNKRLRFPRFELDCDVQNGTGGCSQPYLSYSNDGGRNFNGWSYPLQQAQDQSAPGTFRRFYAHQLGQSRSRVYKVTVTDTQNLQRWVNAFATAEPGTEK